VLRGSSTVINSLAEALERAGAGSLGGTVAGADLVVAVVGAGGLDQAAAGELADECAREGTTFLPVHLAGRAIMIGPLLVPETPLCYACLCAELGDRDVTATADPILHCGILCREVLAFAARVPETRIVRALVRYDLSDWTTTAAAPAPRLDCATCFPVSSSATRARTEPVPTPLRFELATAANPVRFAAGTSPLASIEPRNIAATHGGKQWPSARRIHLPGPGEDPPPSLAGGRGRRLGLDVLALVLSRTAGLRDPRTSPTDRWSPSGGNIGSVHLHVHARGLPDLPDGWYGYDSVEHALAVLREEPAEGGPQVLIVFTGGYRRLVGKYGPFAVRLLAFDAGVALAQLDFVARGLGRELDVLDESPTDDLTEALLFEPDHEPVTAIVRLT
jgi:SagB-type dehydrogenase family enzyme